MRIRFLTFLSAIVFGGLVLILAVLISSWSRVSKRYAQQMKESNDGIHAVEQLQKNLLQHNNELLLLAQGDKGSVRNLVDFEANIAKWRYEMGRHIDTPEEQQAVTTARADIDHYLQESRMSMAIPGVAKMRSKINPELIQTFEKAYDSVHKTVEINIDQSDLLRTEVIRQNKVETAIGMSIILIVLAMIIMLVYGTRQFLYIPLKSLRDTIQKYSRGDRDVKAKEIGPQEMREVAAVFNEMSVTLAKHRADQWRFLAAVAHDLRNPLSAIKMSAELLTTDAGLSMDDLQRTGDIIRRQVSQLDRMVGDLLDTASLEAGNLGLRVASIHLDKIVRESVELYAASSRSHSIQVTMPEGPIPFECDGTRVSQILGNLLSNAIKYSPNGGKISVSVDLTSTGARLVVADSGIGIAPDELQKIFLPFQRSRSMRDKVPGLGLGLATVRKIIESLGGEISVESEHGRGSQFTVFLPKGSA